MPDGSHKPRSLQPKAMIWKIGARWCSSLVAVLQAEDGPGCTALPCSAALCLALPLSLTSLRQERHEVELATEVIAHRGLPNMKSFSGKDNVLL